MVKQAGEAGRQGGQGGIIEQVSLLSPPSSLSPLSLLHVQCPIPNSQIQNSTITGVWSLGWVDFLGSASIIQLVARSYSTGVR
jgi:hypothetical protein